MTNQNKDDLDTSKLEINDKTEPTPKEETISVSKSELAELMKKIDRLEATANKGRLHNYDKNNKEEEETIIKVRLIDGKIITSWRSLTNNVYRDPLTKRIIEDQKIEVTYENDTTEKMDIVTFNRRYVHMFTKLVESTDLKKKDEIDKYGFQRFKLETDEGKKIIIGSNFVN